MVVTVSERKARRIERLRAASREVLDCLRDYGSRHGGRFLVFGSAARGDIHTDSDFDVVVDFPHPAERAARTYVEEICAYHRLTPDPHLMADISDGLKRRVIRDAIIVP